MAGIVQLRDYVSLARLIAFSMNRNVSVLNAGGIKKVANDDAQSIDAVAVCRGSVGKIKLSEDALAIEVAVGIQSMGPFCEDVISIALRTCWRWKLAGLLLHQMIWGP